MCGVWRCGGVVAAVALKRVGGGGRRRGAEVFFFSGVGVFPATQRSFTQHHCISRAVALCVLSVREKIP